MLILTNMVCVHVCVQHSPQSSVAYSLGWRLVQMIIVCMWQKNHIDLQILNCNRRLDESLRAYPLRGWAPSTPHRIGQEEKTVGLIQTGCVSDPGRMSLGCTSALGTIYHHALNQFRRIRCWVELHPHLLATEGVFQYIGQCFFSSPWTDEPTINSFRCGQMRCHTQVIWDFHGKINNMKKTLKISISLCQVRAAGTAFDEVR